MMLNRAPAHRVRPGHMSAGAVALLVMAGCASVNEVTARESTLIGPTWQLATVQQGDALTRLSPEQSAQHTITFVVHDQAQLKLACNSGTAVWTASVMRRTLRIGDISSTKMMCPEPQIATAIMTELPGSNIYSVAADGLTLTIQAKSATFTFRDATS